MVCVCVWALWAAADWGCGGGGEEDGGAQTRRRRSGGRGGGAGDNSELIGCLYMVAETKGGDLEEFQLEQPGRCQVR